GPVAELAGHGDDAERQREQEGVGAELDESAGRQADEAGPDSPLAGDPAEGDADGPDLEEDERDRPPGQPVDEAGRADLGQLGSDGADHAGTSSSSWSPSRSRSEVRERKTSSRLAASTVSSRTTRPLRAASVPTASVVVPLTSSSPDRPSVGFSPSDFSSRRSSAASGVRTRTTSEVRPVSSWIDA